MLDFLISKIKSGQMYSHILNKFAHSASQLDFEFKKSTRCRDTVER